MDILGISAFYHDSAACLLRDGEVLAAAQEERFSRRKHDAAFPEGAVRYCLEAAGTRPERLDAVVFYDKPWLKFERILCTYLAYAPSGLPSFLRAAPLWARRKLWTRELLRKALPGYGGKVYFTEHHESHAASAFFPSPFREAAILTMDGVGEWATSSVGRGSGNRIRLLQELRFPHSLGLLYSAFTYYAGFKVNSGEYKLMGLAPYGEPRFVRAIYDELIDLKPDGSFRLAPGYFDYCAGLRMTSERFHRLFGGPPRTPESPVTQRDMDLARSAQEVCEEVMLRMARHACAVAGSRDLCLAGGVALNCVGNGRLLREGACDRLWVQPAASDAGGALGAATFLWHQGLGKTRPADGVRDRQRASLLGPEYSPEEIDAFLAGREIPHERLAPEETPRRAARLIAEGKVVGWFSGRMEYGPRALGGRSILGDPRDPGMQSRMNLKVKFRESFRPFAPAVLRERVSSYFDFDADSPYMLVTAPVTSKRRIPEEPAGLWGIDRLKLRRSDIPAVTHVDYSARLQTVAREDHPRFWAVLKAFEELTGCAVLINTSLNVRGEPIVCRPEEAYACLLRTDMDCLFLGDFLLEKHRQPSQAVAESKRKDLPLD